MKAATSRGANFNQVFEINPQPNRNGHVCDLP